MLCADVLCTEPSAPNIAGCFELPDAVDTSVVEATVVVGADVAEVAKLGIQAGGARLGNETAGMVMLGSQPVSP